MAGVEAFAVVALIDIFDTPLKPLSGRPCSVRSLVMCIAKLIPGSSIVNWKKNKIHGFGEQIV